MLYFQLIIIRDDKGRLVMVENGAMQEVWLDRVTGRVCMAISAKGMAITGIDDRRYWNWVSTEESRLDINNIIIF